MHHVRRQALTGYFAVAANVERLLTAEVFSADMRKMADALHAMIPDYILESSGLCERAAGWSGADPDEESFMDDDLSDDSY